MNTGWWYAAVEAFGVLLALESVYRTRTAQGAIAWSISLITIPLVAIPMYFLVGGRRFQGYVRARKRGDEAIKAQVARPAGQAGEQPRLPRVQGLEDLVQSRFVQGNQVALLINGDQTFAQIFAAIADARDYILVQFYIVRDDNVGRRFQELLIARAKAGVRVYFLYDEIGSVHLSASYTQRLHRSGVFVSPFNSTKTWRNRLQINFRNHRKLVVVDGRQAFVGGINVGDEYLGHHPQLSPWRDTHVALSGPAVLQAQTAFLEDWFWAAEEELALNWSGGEGDGSVGQRVMVVATGPADRLDTCELVFLQLFNQAQRRLWIVSPYFVPDSSVMHSLYLAALRGVDVRVLLPLRADNLLVQMSSYAFCMDSLSGEQAGAGRGIRFYRYREGFLHQKVVLVDDDISLVGSANLDNRSFRLNFEMGVLVHDVAFASRIEAMLTRDFAGSDRVSHQEVLRKPLYFRWLAKFARLLAPLQ